MNYRLTLSLALSFFSTTIVAQKVLQVERAGQAKTQKIFIGQAINYKLKGADEFYFGVIEDLKVEEGIVLFEDRYVKVEEIAALRYSRQWAKGISKSLFWFGAGWSVFAAVGTATDDNPDTEYQLSDAVVTASAMTSSLIISSAFKHKTIKFGNRKRLRLLELPFSKPN